MASWCEHKCDKKCGKGLTVEAMQNFRTAFWGDLPTPRERRKKVIAAINTARQNYLRLSSIEALDPKDYPSQLLFRSEGKFVCEKYFANLVGMNDRDTSFKNKVWVNEVKSFLDGKTSAQPTRKIAKDTTRCKRDHAYAHIKKVVESQMMDMSAHANFEDHLYLPYQTMTCFYDEYVYLAEKLKLPLYAKRTTFTTAFDDIVVDKKKNENISIRMSSGKGMKCAIILLSKTVISNNFILYLFYPCID